MSKDEAMSEFNAARLVVMRHAKAESTASSDRARELTHRGERDARAAGEWLAAAGLSPDVLLVSTAARARQTAEVVVAALKSASKVVLSDPLYDADAVEVLGICAEVVDADVGCAAVVGHNPTMVEVSMLLQGSDAEPVQLRPGALAVFELDQPWARLGAGSARLVDRFSPRGD